MLKTNTENWKIRVLKKAIKITNLHTKEIVVIDDADDMQLIFTLYDAINVANGIASKYDVWQYSEEKLWPIYLIRILDVVCVQLFDEQALVGYSYDRRIIADLRAELDKVGGTLNDSNMKRFFKTVMHKDHPICYNMFFSIVLDRVIELLNHKNI